MGRRTPDDPWLAGCGRIRTELPPTPATVLEMGCGSMGGFVPALPRARTTGGSRWWRRCHCITWPSWTRPWTSSRRCWCLAARWWSWSGPGSDSTRPPPVVLRPADITRPRAEPGWLHRHQERWAASGKPWDGYLRAWAEQEGLHPGEAILRGLDARFDRRLYVEAPYFFNLADTSDRRAGRHRRRPDQVGRHPVRRHATLTSAACRPRTRPAASGSPASQMPDLSWTARVRSGWWRPWRTAFSGETSEAAARATAGVQRRMLAGSELPVRPAWGGSERGGHGQAWCRLRLLEQLIDAVPAGRLVGFCGLHVGIGVWTLPGRERGRPRPRRRSPSSPPGEGSAHNPGDLPDTSTPAGRHPVGTAPSRRTICQASRKPRRNPGPDLRV
jgi:hypothetical protein